tara:strand:- start:582 stop:869 length:288 start_codon:yes stop_codon:yes gene_type:complete
MKINWKKISVDRYDIHVNDQYIGHVEQNLYCKWKCHPEFNFLPIDGEIFYLLYDNGVTAGREMSKAWERWSNSQEYMDDFDDQMFGFIDDFEFMD